MSPFQTLIEMHNYGRPAGSAIEAAFINRFIRPLDGAWEDIHGNWHVVVAPESAAAKNIVWSCHTDTVHHVPMMQKVHLSRRGRLSLHRKAKSSCLGADDTVGVFLARELVLAGRPGHYIFHYGEEVGCQGSTGLVEAAPEWLKDVQVCIALDRKGTDEVITHQIGRRTCSEAFASALATQLNASSAFNYKPSAHGVYTDSERYADCVPECTNLAVGYYAQHGSGEWVDTYHVLALRDALLRLDVAALPVERVAEPDTWMTEDWTGWESYFDRKGPTVTLLPPSTAPSETRWWEGSDWEEAMERRRAEGENTTKGRVIYLDPQYQDVQDELQAALRRVQRKRVQEEEDEDDLLRKLYGG